MRFSVLTLFALLASQALADVLFSTPAPGSSIPAGLISVSWTDGPGKAPIANLAGWTLNLMVGGNGDSASIAIPLSSLAADFVKNPTSAALSIPATLGPPGNNAYFLKMVSTYKDGGTITNYSQRFTISGMTGTWPSPPIEAAYKQVTSASQVPATLDAPAAGGGNAGAPPPDGAASVPYQFQTGLIRYAPMMPMPGTVITKQNTDPLYPTSAFTVAQTWLPIPTSPISTSVVSGTYSVTPNRVNMATPAAKPMDDMQRFLARWKDDE